MQFLLRSFVSVLGWCLCVLPLAQTLVFAQEGEADSIPTTPDLEAVKRHVTALEQCGDRSPGSEGANKAAFYIQAELTKLGVTPVVQETTIVKAVDFGSSLTATTAAGVLKLSLSAHLPNGAAMPGTFQKTLHGRLVNAKSGSLDDLALCEVSGAIVVMDGDGQDGWMRCMQRGAQAVIFRQPERIDGAEVAHQHLGASYAFPRFIADISDERLGSLVGTQVSLVSDVRPSSVVCQSVIARFNGTEPKMNEANGNRSSVVLSSGYESSGGFAGYNPAASRAWNAALLLELAKQFSVHPVSHDVIVVFHGARVEYFRGLRQFCFGLSDTTKSLGRVEDLPLGDCMVQMAKRRIESTKAIETAFERILAKMEQELGKKVDDRTPDFQFFTEIPESIAQSGTVAKIQDSNEKTVILKSPFFWIAILLAISTTIFVRAARRRRQAEPKQRRAHSVAMVVTALVTLVILSVFARNIFLPAIGKQADRGPRQLAFDLLSQQAGFHADHYEEIITGKELRMKEVGKGKVYDAIVQEIEPLREEMGFWRNIQRKIGKSPLGKYEPYKKTPRYEQPELRTLIQELMGRSATTGKTHGEESLLARHRHQLERQKADYESTKVAVASVLPSAPNYLVELDLSDGSPRIIPYAPVTSGIIPWNKRFQSLVKAFESANDKLRDDGIATGIDSEALRLGSQRLNSWLPSVRSYPNPGDYIGRCLNPVVLVGSADRQERVGSPADRFASFRTDHFASQCRNLTALLRSYFEREGFKNFLGEKQDKDKLTISTISVESPSRGSPTGRAGHPFPLVRMQFLGAPPAPIGTYPNNRALAAQPYQNVIRDVSLCESRWGDVFGQVSIPWVPAIGKISNEKLNLPVYGYDRVGRVSHTVARAGTRISRLAESLPFLDIPNDVSRDRKIEVFACDSAILMGLHDVRRMDDIKTLSVLNAYSESMPTQLSLEHDTARGAAAIFTPPMSRLRVLGVDPGQVNRMVLTGQMRRSDQGPVGLQGTGILVSDTPGRTAMDFWTRDDEKLEHLRKNSITPEATLALQAEAQRLKEAAKSATGARARALSHASWSVSQKVYPAVRSISTDVVYSLIIMLLLCIPFSVLCERLFISGATISRRVIGFFCIFLSTFLFFYFLHPAFGLAQKPTIIFLAFVIMATSAVVMGLLSSRFGSEMEAIQLETLGMHKVDVSRLGTLFATVALGIGNMRRRPTRTFLTALTVILMTFILMTFASFNNSNAVHRRTHVDPPPYNGLLVSRPDRGALHPEDLSLVKEITGDRGTVHLRYWHDNERNKEANDFPVVLQGPKNSVALKGLLGIAPGDPSHLDETLIGPGNVNGFSGQKDLLFVTPKVRSLLGVSLGDKILLFGRVFRIGLINEEALARTTDIGGLGVTPFAKLALSQEMQETLRNTEAMAGIDIANYFSNQAPDDVIIVHADMAKEMRMPATSMVVTPRDPSVDLQSLGIELTGLILFPIQVASDGVGVQMTAVDAMSVSGLTQVLLPLFLGGMIIFSTMLGSVAERGREIFIYASLGLAPIHIAVLFLVEAAIYAILGGMGGYMLAQVVGAVIGLLAKYNLVGQIDINYSSFGAVLVMLMIMAVVLLSALYPAIIAARSAKPGEDADFRVPEPKGDRLDIPFPFTVARQDIGGLMRFLQHWLGAHTEATTGTFTADTPQETIDGQTVTTQCRTWLAPFDLGISQRFALSAKPTDMKAIFALHLRLDLLSGQRSSWRTVLGPFLQEMRQQFLVWRTLDEATRDGYRAQAGDAAAIARIEVRRQAAAEALKAEAAERAKLDEAMKEKAGLTSTPKKETEGAP